MTAHSVPASSRVPREVKTCPACLLEPRSPLPLLPPPRTTHPGRPHHQQKRSWSTASSAPARDSVPRHVKTCPACDSLPGVQPNPPSKFLHASTKCTAAGTSTASARPRIDKHSSAAYEKRVSISPHASPANDPSGCCRPATSAGRDGSVKGDEGLRPSLQGREGRRWQPHLRRGTTERRSARITACLLH
eukprot:361420-Chlamydomonas_euryale.AAC.7